MDESVRLAELMTTRLCHDLAGAVGAVAAGAELFADDPSAAADPATLALLTDSTAALAAKLRLFRAAFGREGGGGSGLMDAAPGDLLAAYLVASQGKLAARLDWGVADGSLPRLALALAVAAVDALPRCRVLRVAGTGGVEVVAQAPAGLPPRAEVLAALNAAASLDGLDPKAAPAALAARLAAARGMIVEARSEIVDDGQLLHLRTVGGVAVG